MTHSFGVNALNLKPRCTSEKAAVNKLLIKSLIIRLLLCSLILIIGYYFIDQLYFISDDVTYEAIARRYLHSANFPVDLQALEAVGVTGYLQVFWPYVMCIAAYIFKTVYAARFINVILSIFVIKYVYELTMCISENHKTAMRAAKLYAYLPYPLLVCCFPIKDIYISLSVIYAFTLFVKFQKKCPIKVRQIVICVTLLIGTYFARGGVVEMLMLFFVMFILKRFYDNKEYLAIMGCLALLAVFLLFMGDDIIATFAHKIDDYSGYAQMDTTISAIQMSSITEFYKLPFTYFFATLQPMKFKLFEMNTSSTWAELIYGLNISIIPVAVGNFLYIFKKKKNYLFWICSLVMYCAVATLSLGIFRHYLFLLPIEMINFSLFFENSTKGQKNVCWIASVALVLLIVLYSMI